MLLIITAHSANEILCNFSVKRCSAPSYSGSFTCTAGSSYLYGAVCTFDCSAIGHELIGQSTVTCLSSGSWDNAIPSCQRMKLLEYSLSLSFSLIFVKISMNVFVLT